MRFSRILALRALAEAKVVPYDNVVRNTLLAHAFLAQWDPQRHRGK